MTSNQAEELGAIGLSLAGETSQALPGLKSFVSALFGLVGEYSGENQKFVNDYILRLIDVVLRVEKIKYLLKQEKLCLKSKSLDEKVEEFQVFLKSSSVSRVLSRAKFENDLLKKLSDVLYHFSMYLADFSIALYAIQNPDNENNSLLLKNLKEACSEKISEKKKSPAKQTMDQFLKGPSEGKYAAVGSFEEESSEEETPKKSVPKKSLFNRLFQRKK